MSKFLKSVSQSVKGVKEVDSWYEVKKLDANTCIAHLEKCLKLLEKVSKSRKSLSGSLVDVATRFSDTGAVETASSLSLYVSIFGKFDDISGV